MALIIGKDKKNRPILLTRIQYLNPRKTTEFRMRNFVFYTMEQLMKQLPPNDGRFCAITDFNGASLFNVNLGQLREMIPIVQDCYTETMHKVYVVNSNLLLRILWVIVVKLFESKTLKRVNHYYNIDKLYN